MNSNLDDLIDVGISGEISSHAKIFEMKPSVRLFTEADYPMIVDWYQRYDGLIMPLELMPLDSTFLLELDGKPALCVTLYTTNCKGITYAEGFIGNPDLKTERKEHTQFLTDHVFEFARLQGFRRIVCFAPNVSLSKWYAHIGFRPTMNDLSALVKEL